MALSDQDVGIGEVARQTGMSIHALRFYERQGLIPRSISRDSSSRHRRYSKADIVWFQICGSLRQSGMPLTTLRQYTDLVRAGPGNEEERLSLLRAHQSSIETQLAVLKKAQALINYKIAAYELGLQMGRVGELGI